MAKRSQAKRQKHDSSYVPGYFVDDEAAARQQRASRHRWKRQSPPDASNIVALTSRHTPLDTAYTPQRQKAPFEARSASQQRYINAIKTHALTFGIGPAGTGKSYCAGALAAEALESGRIDRIIITRPAVEAGEKLGFLPGELNDKFSVYIDAFRDILNERLGRGVVDYCLRHGRIVGQPLAYMRGKSFGSNTFVILDEAQNTTPQQMKMFLTRIGEHCRVVVNGDVRQSDIHGRNGLEDALERVAGLDDVYVHAFERDDIVRSGLVRALLDRYE